jgi:hypothetical protein
MVLGRRREGGSRRRKEGGKKGNGVEEEEEVAPGVSVTAVLLTRAVARFAGGSCQRKLPHTARRQT